MCGSNTGVPGIHAYVLNLEKSVVFSYWILIFCASTCRTSGSRKTSNEQRAAARASEPSRAGDRLRLRRWAMFSLIAPPCQHQPTDSTSFLPECKNVAQQNDP